MSSKCYIMNVNRTMDADTSGENKDSKPPVPKEKVMSYEEKSVGSTAFFKCEACPYMALAEDDIKFHLFTVHPDLAKSNGLADNIQIPCPGCSSVFDTEETLRTHLRNHHKMGIKDVKKMVKSLVQIALKNAKLKKEDKRDDIPQPGQLREETDVKIPQVIEIVPDIVNTNNAALPKGVAFISVDELHKMSTPNFEKVDPKEIIQEASINIVYTNDVSTQYVNVSSAGGSSKTCNLIQVSNVPPDLISSIQPKLSTIIEKSSLGQSPVKSTSAELCTNALLTAPKQCKTELHIAQKDRSLSEDIIQKETGELCSVDSCVVRLKDPSKLSYHRRCHQNGKLQCPECTKICLAVEPLHTHLWKAHAVDMELPTCDICSFKTYKRHRLFNIHMKCHGKLKNYSCSICSKSFKNGSQLSKHKLIHKRDTTPVQCSICQREFSNERRLKVHVAAVHDKLKPFKCGHCSHTTARKEEMKLHLRSHTGDKPYSCKQCNYKSADHNAMRRHRKVHTKENMYKCKYCPYTAIQSTMFASHMISKHPNINSNDVHRCPYCPFKSVNKDKYVVHLTEHSDKEGVQLLMEITRGKTKSWPRCNLETEDKTTDNTTSNEQVIDTVPKPVMRIPIEVYDCDSLSESIPKDYSKNYCATSVSNIPQTDYSSQVMVTDLSKDDNNSDCLISESSNDTLIDRHQYTTQHTLQLPYNDTQSNLHFLNPSVSLEQSLLKSNNVSSIPSTLSPIGTMSSNIMSNFPIRLPPIPQLSVRNNITLKAVDKISLTTTKVMGPIIKPTQILPVPSSSNSPVNICNEQEGLPRKKPKISVKSNLILKGPDQENMFHSQQKMAFKRLEDNERFCLGRPVTFNNLITTQFMQLQPEPELSESPNNIMSYPQETMLVESATTPVDNEMNDSSQIFAFNQQLNVNSMLPSSQKIQTNDPSYIKLEATIKQNTQSPSLERMCNANLLTNQSLNREYKASPPLEDIHKNLSEIKNEVKSDAFYNIPLPSLNSTAPNSSMIDQYNIIDNIMSEQYTGHMDLSAAVLPEISDPQNDVIEIDDNSDDNKLLPRFDMNFPLESLYLMHNDFHFLDNDILANNMPNEVAVNEMNRIVTEVPIINPKDNLDMATQDTSCTVGDFPNFTQGKKDPMMNTSVKLTTNKINVKNIELMKN